jgi:molybdate transport system ATP-binding protein
MGLSGKIVKQVNGFKLQVDWRIENELAVFFGYSGAGKSLTLQLIAGLLKPDTGRIAAKTAGGPGPGSHPPAPGLAPG